MFVQSLEKPTSRISDELIVPDPYIISTSKTFKQPFNIEMGCADTAAKIYYTLDGSAPTAASTPYTSPITISANTTVKAVAVENGKTSFAAQAVFTKIRDDIKLTLVNKYLAEYPDLGENSLINGLRGKANWRIGNWQGWQGNDLIAIVDQGSAKPVKRVSLGTLQDVGSWIVFPQYVQYWVSDDGINYKLAATVNTKIDVKERSAQTQDFTALLNLNTRYIKVIAKQYGPLPEWHESKGQPSYIFADEIVVE